MSTAVDLDAVIQQARHCLKKGDLTQAAALYEQVVAQNSTHLAAHEGLATVAFMMKDYPRALDYFQRVIKLDPRRAQPLVNMGAVYNRKGEFQQAAKVLRQALSKDRKCAEAYYNLGIAHKGLNQLSMAVSAYREAIRLDPEMAEAYQNLANVYHDMGNFQQAILNYQRALELRPGFERAKHGLERAQASAAAARMSASPFGRLVSVTESRAAVEEAESRVLTPQERFEDRLAVHGHAKELERAAAVMLNQVRDHLEPALLELTHAFHQSHGRYDFGDEFTNFQRTKRGFEQIHELLVQAGDKLHQHENAMRG